jgi:hypothetical protein
MLPTPGKPASGTAGNIVGPLGYEPVVEIDGRQFRIRFQNHSSNALWTLWMMWIASRRLLGEIHPATRKIVRAADERRGPLGFEPVVENSVRQHLATAEIGRNVGRAAEGVSSDIREIDAGAVR